VIRVAEACEPRTVVVENVPEMLKWRLYSAWRMALTDLGYRVSEQVLDAADAGVPQHRRRLFVVATRGRRPVTVRQPSMPHVTARAVLDVDVGEWSPVAGHCARTLARVDAGRREFGDVFLVAYYGSETGGRSLDRPIGTLTTVDRYALVRGDRMRMLTVAELTALQGFPAGYPLTGTHRDRVMQLGNSVPPPLARHVVGEVMA
jgi:DNA (cytosine-5)-methyltransferase 1